MPTYSHKKVDLSRKAPAAKWAWSSFAHPSRKVSDKQFTAFHHSAKFQVHPLLPLVATFPFPQDNLRLSHWRRAADPEEPYKFAKFDVIAAIPTFSSDEYSDNLMDDDWTERETRLLFDM